MIDSIRLIDSIHTIRYVLTYATNILVVQYYSIQVHHAHTGCTTVQYKIELVELVESVD